MNLYFLLEGRRSEPAVYRHWLGYALPELREVQNLGEMTEKCFRLKSAGGYPRILQILEDSVQEVEQAPVELQHFFLFLDAEEETYEDRYAEVSTFFQRLNPRFPFTVIVQDCCLETWLLGNRSLFKAPPKDTALRELKSFFDVSQRNPEEMPAAKGYETRAQFHYAYLKTALRDRGLSYSKKNSGQATLEESFLEELVERWRDTGHLRSFGHLVRSWRNLGAEI